MIYDKPIFIGENRANLKIARDEGERGDGFRGSIDQLFLYENGKEKIEKNIKGNWHGTTEEEVLIKIEKKLKEKYILSL